MLPSKAQDATILTSRCFQILFYFHYIQRLSKTRWFNLYREEMVEAIKKTQNCPMSLSALDKSLARLVREGFIKRIKRPYRTDDGKCACKSSSYTVTKKFLAFMGKICRGMAVNYGVQKLRYWFDNVRGKAKKDNTNRDLTRAGIILFDPVVKFAT